MHFTPPWYFCKTYLSEIFTKLFSFRLLFWKKNNHIQKFIKPSRNIIKTQQKMTWSKKLKKFHRFKNKIIPLILMRYLIDFINFTKFLKNFKMIDFVRFCEIYYIFLSYNIFIKINIFIIIYYFFIFLINNHIKVIF
jgi:hypothetical protein